MADKPVVGLRYCGGCNPRYDRVAAVGRLRAQLPDVELRPAAPGQPAVVRVCGCPARCAGTAGLDGKLVWLCAPEDLDRAIQQVKEIND